MSQTTYNFNPGVGVEGMVAEGREGNVIISKLASGAVPVGKLCYPGTDPEVGPSPTSADINSANPGQCIAWPAGIADDPLLHYEYLGIPLYDSSRPPYDSTHSDSDKDYVPILRKGPIWVKPEATFSDEKRKVYVRVTASGAFTTLGAFAGASGTGLVVLTGARWMSAVNANGLAVLEMM